MHILFLAAAIAGPAAPDARAEPVCDSPDIVFTQARTRARGTPLGDQPPASHYLTVFRTVDGCMTPIVVRSGIGAPAPLDAPATR